MEHQITTWLERFPLLPETRHHAVAVVHRLPEAVRQDLMEDPRFLLCDYEPGPRAEIPVAVPQLGSSGRSVALKRTLLRRPEPFVRYVIAHELAHAFLRNAGRFPDEDPEVAADALAADWGFPRPW